MTFRLRGIRIEISFWFVAVLTLLLVLSPQSNGAWCFLLCMLHECGHLGAMFLSGKRPLKVEFGYFGMKIVTGERMVSPGCDIIIALSGPAVNLLLAAVFHFFGRDEIAVVSLALGVFNLLPVTVLDGGRILSYIFTDSRALKKIGIVTSVVLTAVGAAVAVYSRTNFIILIVALYLLIGVICDR